MNKFTKVTVIIMPESVTGYEQVFTYDYNTSICTEQRCGCGEGCFTVTEIDSLSPTEWERRVSAFQNRVKEFQRDFPQYTFKCIVE